MQGARRITWSEFERALSMLALEKGSEAAAVQQAVAACPGPTQAGFMPPTTPVRLHDSRAGPSGASRRLLPCCGWC